MKLTEDEKKLIEFKIFFFAEYSKMLKTENLYDIILAFILSENDKMRVGISLELPSGVGFCAERHAIANMILKETEKAKIKVLLVAGPVPKSFNKPLTPCSACRLAINEFGTERTTVICSEFIRNEKGWETFPKMWKFKIKDLYPLPWKGP